MRKRWKIAWLSDEAMALMRQQIKSAKVKGRRIEVPPYWVDAVRDAGLWDDAIHVERRAPYWKTVAQDAALWNTP